MRRSLSLVSIALACVLAPADAISAVPDPATSTLPPCFAVCPGSDIVTTVTVRDAASNPIAGSSVVIDFNQCTGVVLCAPDGSENYTILPGPKLTKVTDAAGEAVFSIRAGGVCQGGPTIYADGVPLRQYSGVASPDQNASLLVDNADDVILFAKVGGNDVTGDLDCDGSVTPADQAELQTHVGHSCFSIGIPGPGASTTPPCLRVCPQGDLVTTVVVRDVENHPVPNSTVVVDFSQCPGLALCPSDGSESYTIAPGPMVSKLTNAAGEAVFPIRAGGVCQGSPTIYADGVILRQYMGVASPDQDGSLVVDSADDAIYVSTKLGTLDVTGDFDCDGDSDAVDLFTLRAHPGHTCPIIVPAERRSWGELKVRYR